MVTREEQDRLCQYNVTWMPVRATIVAVEKHSLSVSL